MIIDLCFKYANLVKNTNYTEENFSSIDKTKIACIFFDNLMKEKPANSLQNRILDAFYVNMEKNSVLNKTRYDFIVVASF